MIRGNRGANKVFPRSIGVAASSVSNKFFVVEIVSRLAAKYPWFKPSIRDIRLLRIEENNDLLIALDDEDDD